MNEEEIKKTKIKSFTDLRVWQEGHALAIAVYEVTRSFPREEAYSLTDQMRRAVVSITSNVAEGFGRQTYKEKIQFYYMAHGSLTELKNQLLLAKDIGYLKKSDLDRLAPIANNTHKLLQGLIRKSKEILKS